MKKKFYETDEFKKLEKEWNKKLKASGFNDIESQTERQTYRVVKQEFTVNHQQVDYFKDCDKYLQSGKITDKLDFFIFEQHVLGKNNVEIADLLTKADGYRKISHQAISKRILNILKDAGIPPFQFNL